MPASFPLPRRPTRAALPSAALALAPVLALAGLGAGCATTRYASPVAAQSAGDVLPLLTYPIFKNRTVAVRVLDNRVDRPQSVVLVDEVRALVEGSLSRAQLGKASEPPAVFEVRIARYGAESELARWKGCTAFGATVEITPAVRHEVTAERCAVTENVWGTESAEQVLREAFRAAARDLFSQVDMLRAPARAVSPVAPAPTTAPAGPVLPAAPAGPAEPAPRVP